MRLQVTLGLNVNQLCDLGRYINEPQPPTVAVTCSNQFRIFITPVESGLEESRATFERVESREREVMPFATHFVVSNQIQARQSLQEFRARHRCMALARGFGALLRSTGKALDDLGCALQGKLAYRETCRYLCIIDSLPCHRCLLADGEP